MPRASFIVAACVAALPATGAAQTAADSIPLDDLRTPASPAFVLLGTAPSAVERPSSPRALAATLFSATKGGNVIPDNLAVEFSPYWMAGHPTMTFDRFYHAGLGTRVLRNLSLSVATEREDLGGGDTRSNVAFGIRTLLAEGSPSERLTNLTSELRQELRDLQIRQLDADDELQAAEEALASAQTADAIARARRDLEAAQQQMATLNDAVRATALEIQQEDRSRSGWVVEIAGAFLTSFPNDSFSGGDVRTVGFWLTPSYRLRDASVDFVGVARVLLREEDTGPDSFDLGGRLVWKADRIALSAEGVFRSTFESVDTDPAPSGALVLVENTYRLSGNLEYRINRDAVVSVTFGRDFLEADGRNLLALIGANIGLGKIPFLDPL